MHGAIVTINYETLPGYVVSDIHGGKVISDNGFHVGVLYEGKIYCNVHPYGLPEQEWVDDFHGTPEYSKRIMKMEF